MVNIRVLNKTLQEVNRIVEKPCLFCVWGSLVRELDI